MAGIVQIPWYATVFRGDKLEAALADVAPVALRYGATSYSVLRNVDDRYKFVQSAAFESKSDWERYWNGPEMTDFRIVNMGYYQVPLVYTWSDLVVEGRMPDVELEGQAPSVGDIA